jgi:hypothetical protein
MIQALDRTIVELPIPTLERPTAPLARRRHRHGAVHGAAATGSALRLRRHAQSARGRTAADAICGVEAARAGICGVDTVGDVMPLSWYSLPDLPVAATQ